MVKKWEVTIPKLSGEQPRKAYIYLPASYSKDKEKSEADFIQIVVFGKQAENCEKYLDKGRQAAVQGRIIPIRTVRIRIV